MWGETAGARCATQVGWRGSADDFFDYLNDGTCFVGTQQFPPYIEKTEAQFAVVMHVAAKSGFRPEPGPQLAIGSSDSGSQPTAGQMPFTTYVEVQPLFV